MTKSAGILVYRQHDLRTEYLLVHPGGPFWKNKDTNAWSIPKGEYTDSEEAETAARREFEEETGVRVTGILVPLTPQKQKSGKLIVAFAGSFTVDADQIRSNLFEMEWPPRSGKKASFPEVDKAGWFTKQEALEKIVTGQRPFLDELEKLMIE